MLDPKQIESWIAEGLSCQELRVEGDGEHFRALIVSDEFRDLNKVKRQQRVYQVIKQHLDSGALHAISMQTLTPDERQQALG